MDVQQRVAEIDLCVDFENGEGWVTLLWKDEYGYSSSLTIDFDGWCSREMPVRSGQGPPNLLGLERDRVRLAFPRQLAESLQLDEVVEFRFQASDDTHRDLEQFFAPRRSP